MKSAALKWIGFLAVAAMATSSADVVLADDGDVCSGQQMLSKPRSETSCFSIKPRVYASPDQAMRAYVYPTGHGFERVAGHREPRGDPRE